MLPMEKVQELEGVLKIRNGIGPYHLILHFFCEETTLPLIALLFGSQ